MLPCGTMLDPRVDHGEAAGKRLAAALDRYRASWETSVP